jgi:hypothetical protein
MKTERSGKLMSVLKLIRDNSDILKFKKIQRFLV